MQHLEGSGTPVRYIGCTVLKRLNGQYTVWEFPILRSEDGRHLLNFD
jgi:hypothetical protein